MKYQNDGDSSQRTITKFVWQLGRSEQAFVSFFERTSPGTGRWLSLVNIAGGSGAPETRNETRRQLNVKCDWESSYLLIETTTTTIQRQRAQEDNKQLRFTTKVCHSFMHTSQFIWEGTLHREGSNPMNKLYNFNLCWHAHKASTFDV